MNNYTNFITSVKIKLSQGIFVFYKDLNHQLFIDSKSGKIYISDENNECVPFIDDNNVMVGTPEDYIVYDPEVTNG